MEQIIIDDDNFDFATLVEELKDARAAKAEAEKREKQVREKLIGILSQRGATQAITASGEGVYIQQQQRHSVNGKKLEAMHPDIYQEVMSINNVTILKTI